MKSLAFTLSLISILTLAGCGGSKNGTEPAAEPSSSSTDHPAASPESAEAAAIKVQHVLIGFRDAVGFEGRQMPSKASGRSQMEAESLAKSVFDRAKKGEDFDALVKEYTDDSPPGIYGMVNRGQPERAGFYERDGMAPAFGNVGFALKVDEIGMSSYNPETSPYGWHIIKRIE